MNSQIDELHKQATQAAYSTATKNGASAAGGAAGVGGALKPPVKPPEGVAGFFSAMGKVIRSDLGMGK